jgi:threonine synthase
MLYYSTNRRSEPVSLKNAVIGGLPDDGGLYLPEKLPEIPASYFKTIERLSFREIAFDIACAYLKDDVPTSVLSEIIDGSFDFPLPLREVEKNIFSLELFHGPTMAFKDVGARFMSRLMAFLYRDEARKLNVIVATSGDTGSAIASGFYNVENINVFVLFPRAKVSPLQQKQITTWGNNIHAIEVNGSFDDCQRLSKELLADRELNSRLSITSANSINIARLIPQSFYYYYAYSLLKGSGLPVVFSVPSGNFGNLTGGIIAGASGLPVRRFIASININDVFKRFMDTGFYNPTDSRQTISSAMDVGDPSNFARISDLMGGSLAEFKRKIISYSFTDEQTRKAIAEVSSKNGYIMDPHGAVAWLGGRQYLEQQEDNVNIVFLETAHPAKFPEIMKSIIPGYEDMPPQLQSVADKTEKFIKSGNDVRELKYYINTINGQE